jgi:hypothetical protein
VINHVRTLLCNVSAASVPADARGRAYTDPAYVPRRCLPQVEGARAALFGPGADAVGVNLTAARFLACLHASPLSEYALTDDPRITYDPAVPADVFSDLGLSVEDGPDPVRWAGAPTFDLSGRGFDRWTVATDGTGRYSVVSETTGLAASGDVEVLTDGDAVPLSGSGASVVVESGSSDTRTVALLAAPTHSFVRVLSYPGLSSLFRPTGSAADATWFRVWSSPGPVWFKAVAVGLALEARTGESGL